MPNVGPGFYKKLLKVTSEVGMKPEDLLKVMAVESGINPLAHNKNGDASGLLQFMPSTLKIMGFKGDHEDFRQLSAEEQLDYVEKLIKNMMRINGGPFTSAAQYYVGNFIPVALKLPGIKAGDSKTIIVAKSPDKPHLLGVSPELESTFYKANSGLDFDKDGLITFGDIQSIINKSAAGKNYQTALLDMKNATGYEPMKNKVEKSTSPDNINNILNSYLQQIVASEKLNKKLYNKFLPNNNIVIQINGENYTNGIEFARILCSALEEELLSRAYTHINNKEIEVECSIAGPKDECFEVVKQLTNSLLEEFKVATKKIGKININTQLIMNKKSSYQQIDFETANMQYRKFLLKFI